MKVGVFVCVRNNCNRKAILTHMKAGEAGAIDGDRAFFNDQVAEIPRESKIILPAAIHFRHLSTGGYCVHMSLYNMPVYATIEWQASFQIDL